MRATLKNTPILPRLYIFAPFLSKYSISEFKLDISAKIFGIFWPHFYFTTFVLFFTFVCPQLPLQNFGEIFSLVQVSPQNAEIEKFFKNSSKLSNLGHPGGTLKKLPTPIFPKLQITNRKS